MVLARTRSVSIDGVRGHVVEVEADITAGLPGTSLVGSVDGSLGEARDRCRAAVVNSGCAWPARKVTIGLSPASLPKAGAHYDLAILLAWHTKRMDVSIYCRISKDRAGAGLGVKAQEADCRTLAATLGATVATVRTDNDISAYSGKPRPGYRALLADVRAGAVGAVLVWHTDRLHRSPRELEDYIAACEPAGVATHTVKAGPIDLSTPSGRLVARQLGSVARYEVEHAVERMQRAKQRSAEAGTWKGGRRPFGYEADGVTIREAEARLVRSGVDAILAGASVHSVARDWNAAGSTTTTGRPWQLSGPRRVILRPRNAGLMEHRGEILGSACWPAIVDAEKWRSAVRVLTEPSRRTNPGPSTRKWLGSGIYRCGVCRGRLRSSSRTRDAPIYRCPSGHVVRGQNDLDGYVEAVVAGRLRRADAANLLRPSTSTFDVQAAEARTVELRHRLNQLAAVFAEGDIDAEQLAAGTRLLNTDLDRVRADIDAAYSGTMFEGLGSSPDPGAAWLHAPLDRKRAVLDALVRVTVHKAPAGRPAGWRAGESYFQPETVRLEWRM